MKLILLIALYLLELVIAAEADIESSGSEDLEELQGSHLIEPSSIEEDDFPVLNEFCPTNDDFQTSKVQNAPAVASSILESQFQSQASGNYFQSLNSYALQGILPRVLFIGTSHWDQLLKVYKSPFIFVSLFQLSLNIFKPCQPRLQFGVKFSDEEVREFKGFSQAMLIDYISHLKDYFQAVTGVVLKYCIFTGEDDVRFRIERVFGSKEVYCFTPKPWELSKKNFQLTLVNTRNTEHLKEALNIARKKKRKSLTKNLANDDESVVSVFSDREIEIDTSSSDSEDL